MPMSLWYPYAQMKTMSPPLDVASASGAVLQLTDGRKLIDSISSWWCVIHGYNHPVINAAIQQQLTQMSHVMLGGLTHEPARKLADKLVAMTPDGLNHVFFGDSGSVGVEIALKMAIQYHKNAGSHDKTQILALEKAYHGDTIGAMSVCDPVEGMHSLFAGLLPQQRFLPAPIGGFDADESATQHNLKLLSAMLDEHANTIAAFIVEPLIQAAGGFNFYSPTYLKEARRICDEHNVLLIFDEVATGFGRAGSLFAADQTGITPDIMVLGKGLTAGYAGHSAVMATDRLFNAFLSDDESKSFMHGPTFMGNPMACTIALSSIELFEKEDRLSRIQQIESILKDRILPITGKAVKDTRVLGATGVVEVDDSASLQGVQNFAADRGVWLRPFGTYAYTMPPYVITDEQLHQICDVLQAWFKQ
ncbi:MAG TPA: adenosylmethionine--8-amino-7-oxononanoate transaminase [Phycisphaerales bacterium]|nr:adenosylmethionine--8-amino-7-oxononanoate transaminase [Phycisphaerales bacterium]HCD33653.1 adenosylmethionine--8-amino-7-oxononanoate transaminase [Phycisphaerales bacterium]